MAEFRVLAILGTLVSIWSSYIYFILFTAIIAGAVVGLLLMILLVMFIVYRMRKKDEGSYPLDEQKYQNYPYAKAPTKEFYA